MSTIDQAKKMALIRKIRRVQSQTHRGKEKEIVLSLEDYFDGDSSDCCTILANTRNPLSGPAFRDFLATIAAKPDVSNVLIRFYDYEDALDVDDAWINSDTVYVSTSASATAVHTWFETMEPSSVEAVSDRRSFANLPTIPDGHALFAVWWD